MKKNTTLRMQRFVLVACIVILSGASCLAQQTATEKRDEKTKERNFDGMRYKMRNNYINFGLGYGSNFSNRQSVPVGVGYNFHIGKQFFQAGYNRTELPFLWGSYTENFMNDLHLAFVIRKETKKLNLAYAMGVGRAWGLKKNIAYGDVAGYAEVQFIRKLYYDVGAGLSMFVNYNREYPMAGIRFDFFLSSSYQGVINGQ
jgi:hypothetical protein